MPNPTSERSYRSRWARQPLRDEHGIRRRAVLGPRDIELFKLLARYRYLRADFIHALLGGNLKALVVRLRYLQSEPNCYIRRPPHSFKLLGLSRYLIYELDENGASELRTRGIEVDLNKPGDGEQFSHAMMISDTLASIEIGIKADPAARLMTWKEITERPTFPAATLQSGNPRAIPVSISRYSEETQRAQHADFDYLNDALFGIEREGRALFFQLEAEHKNRVDCGNLNQTSFLKKFLAIQHIIKNQLYKARWGRPNLLTLVVAPTRERIETMKRLIMRETEGRGCTYMLFREIPVMEDMHRASNPDPTLYTAPWERAGHPDFFIKQ